MKKNMSSEEVFSRTIFGIVMLLVPFISWWKWVIFVLGFLFLISAYQGFCFTCALYRWLFGGK